MPRPSRARRILKWSGLLLALLIAAIWIASLWWWIYFVFPGNRAYVALNHWAFIGTATKDVHLFMRSSGGPVRHDLPIKFGIPRIEAKTSKGQLIRWVEIPYWFTFLIVVIPTAWLWHRDRRSQRILPGHCPRCGYDLTGNTSGVCPECGDPPRKVANSECGKAKPPPATV